MSARIVFEHRFGPWAGLMQIVGTAEDFKGETAPPATTEPFRAIPDNRRTMAGLVASRGHGRWLLYRELQTPDVRSFNPRQQ